MNIDIQSLYIYIYIYIYIIFSYLHVYFTQTKIQNNVYKYIIIINNTLENIGNWLKAKKMALNVKKIKFNVIQH